ncbi:MAG: hypothetical protein KDH90_04350, partial [Anaerolineae bacterium]|nr:hypothetical protein [Anaerolineae bacterium]
SPVVFEFVDSLADRFSVDSSSADGGDVKTVLAAGRATARLLHWFATPQANWLGNGLHLASAGGAPDVTQRTAARAARGKDQIKQTP